MQNTVKISCEIGSTDIFVKLGMEIWVDNQQIFNCDHVANTQLVHHEIFDSDGEHELRFIMKNKTQEHTKIDQNGNIIKDACLTVNHLQFDEINIDQIFVEKAQYVHNFNGADNCVHDKFYGIMGCNGTVSLKFNTPFYLWLLENM